jgi:hypothetical protein
LSLDKNKQSFGFLDQGKIQILFKEELALLVGKAKMKSYVGLKSWVQSFV